MKISNVYVLKRRVNKVFTLACILFSVVILGSCNESYPDLLNTSYPEGTPNFPGKNSKILLITVDGLNGTALTNVGDTHIPNIVKMKKNALFSFRSLADFSQGPMDYPIAYANIFTGVNRDKHNYSGNVVESNLSSFPSFLDRVKENYPDRKIALFSTNEAVIKDFAEKADVKEYGTADQDMVTKTVAYLKNENPAMVMVNLSNPEKVGKDVGYTADKAAYVTAIEAVDQQIGALKAAIEGRKDYALENWMVIVTSTQGAGLNSGTTGGMAYDDLSRNTFTLFYHNKFNSVPVATPNVNLVPFTSQSPVYNGSQADNNTALIPDDAGLYNFGTEEFTIRFTIKGSGVAASWPAFLSKSTGMDTNLPGWRLYISGQNLSLQVAGNGGFANWGSGMVVNDGKWHNVAVVFFRESGRRKVKVFVDGVKATAIQDVEDRGTMNTTEPLRVGRNRGGVNNPDIQLAHLQFYRAAWTDQEVMSNFCKVEVNDKSLYYDRLVGYWPSNEGDGNRLYNRAQPGLGKDLILQGKYGWKSFSDISEKLCPEVNKSFYQIVPNAVDISATVYAWLGIPVKASWNMDGKVWPFTFNSVRP